MGRGLNWESQHQGALLSPTRDRTANVVVAVAVRWPCAPSAARLTHSVRYSHGVMTWTVVELSESEEREEDVSEESTE